MTAVVSDAVAASAATDRLKLTEIFLSLQGEARDAGWPTVFVRLTGCPLRCTYCDTAYAFHGGDWWSIDDILVDVARHGVRHVCVTGGEPLAQKRCIGLLQRLCDAGYVVSLETSGAIDIAAVTLIFFIVGKVCAHPIHFTSPDHDRVSSRACIEREHAQTPVPYGTDWFR